MLCCAVVDDRSCRRIRIVDVEGAVYIGLVYYMYVAVSGSSGSGSGSCS